jgi:hypothetical protein
MSVDAVSNLAANGGAHAVKAALTRAADATGVDFDVLYNMARRESSLDPDAKAKTSSAAGLFQFIDQTWLGVVKKHGASHGLAEEAAAITRDASGKYVVNDPQKREAILDLRFNPAKAAALAGELVNDNRQGLERRLGRAVNDAEVYAAHFLGTGGAAKLLSASADARAADLLPKAAAANRGVFYDGARARTVGEVIASIEKSMGAAPAAPPKSAPIETKSASFRETAFSALRVDAHPAPVEKSPPAMTQLLLAALQAIDPTRLGESRDGAEARLR